MSEDWYTTWFDSPYYHILYKHRDFEEAELFIDNLISHLAPARGAKVLDLACGKGRHALYLCKKGLDVTGVDLSPQNIEAALSLRCEHLNFQVQDMRIPVENNYYDYVFNFFTSFGYFNSENDNIATMIAIREELKAGGMLVLDFMNVHRVIANLVEEEEKQQEGITFHIQKKYADRFILKQIRFADKGQNFEFVEQVQALELKDFRKYLDLSGMELVETFGNYELAPFKKESSERLIILAKKPE